MPAGPFISHSHEHMPLVINLTRSNLARKNVSYFLTCLSTTIRKTINHPCQH